MREIRVLSGIPYDPCHSLDLRLAMNVRRWSYSILTDVAIKHTDER